MLWLLAESLWKQTAILKIPIFFSGNLCKLQKQKNEANSLHIPHSPLLLWLHFMFFNAFVICNTQPVSVYPPELHPLIHICAPLAPKTKMQRPYCKTWGFKLVIQQPISEVTFSLLTNQYTIYGIIISSLYLRAAVQVSQSPVDEAEKVEVEVRLWHRSVMKLIS